jgi:hypothetical protein
MPSGNVRRPNPTGRKVIGLSLALAVLLGACAVIFNGGMWGG